MVNTGYIWMALNIITVDSSSECLGCHHIRLPFLMAVGIVSVDTYLGGKPLVYMLFDYLWCILLFICWWGCTWHWGVSWYAGHGGVWDVVAHWLSRWLSTGGSWVRLLLWPPRRNLGQVLYLQLPVRFGVKLKYSIHAVVRSVSE